MKRLRWVALAALAACGSSRGSLDAGGTGANSGGGGDASGGGGSGVSMGNGPMSDAQANGSGGNCEPPDMLIVLDRTMSMHRKPDGTVAADTPAGHMESKWYIAINAIEAVTASLDETVRFGLELFPRDPGGGKCVTLSQRITGTTATNTSCEGGEVPVSPGLATSGMIASTLDPETTRLCNTTPIGAALGTAQTHLASIQKAVRDQFVLLLTDGQATCKDDAMSIKTVQELAQAGVKTYVIGFDSSGSGVDPVQLNELACAGRTAPGFPAACSADANGDYTATDPKTGTLYLTANDSAALQKQLEQVAGQVCCNCIQ